MRAYYAHCQAIYGTPQEERDQETIRNLGYEPIAFGLEIQEAADKAKKDGFNPMREVFFPLVETSEVLFFRALPDGRVPAGVMGEIIEASRLNIPVLELPSGLMSREMSIEQTREYLREIGQR